MASVARTKGKLPPEITAANSELVWPLPGFNQRYADFKSIEDSAREPWPWKRPSPRTARAVQEGHVKRN